MLQNEEQIRKISKFVGRIVLELGIVFCGVYFAFLFNEYTNDREIRQQQVQLLQALDTEISYFLGGAQRREQGMKQNFEQWQAAIASGKQEVPLYFEIQGNALPTKNMWQVVLYFDGINLIDLSLMFDLSKYYNSFDIMLSKYQKLIDFAEREIIPFENNPRHFYQSNSVLTPKYAAYVRRYADFLQLFSAMIKDSEMLKKQLQTGIEQHK